MKFKLSNKATIIREELTAIAKALCYAKTIKRDKILIVTDSRSALQHLDKCNLKSKGIPYEALKFILDSGIKNRTIITHWIP